jgi:hypothetical protein
MLGERGIKPESLPQEEDIKKLERRVKSEEKKLEKRRVVCRKRERNHEQDITPSEKTRHTHSAGNECWFSRYVA